jgi:hypothetical protein
MSLNAESRLVLVRVKTKWAEKQLRRVAAEILALQHMIIVVRDTKTGVAPHPFTFMFDDRFQKVPTLSFDVISLAGDVIHNLRSALDHLANQLALVGCPTLTDKELRQIEFPIAETLKKYEDDKARKVKGMRPEAVKAIDDLKLYKGGNDPLWRLHELDNIDKHRTLFTVAHDFLYTSDWFDGAYLHKTENPHFAGLEPDVEKNIQLEIERAASDPQIVYKNALLPMLHQLVDFVDSLIVSFRPLLE